jgi:hypothetical protein
MQVIRDEVMKTMGMGAGPMGTGTRCCIHLALLLVCLVAVVSMQENIECYICCLVFLGNVVPPVLLHLWLSEY